jgi:hypothetical protein
MMRIPRTVGIAIILLTLPPGADAQVTYRAYGAGLRACRTWSNDRQQPSAHLINLSWVLGFISGLAWGGEVIRETDFAKVEQWMDAYCERNSFDTIARAATALAEDLTSGR